MVIPEIDSSFLAHTHRFIAKACDPFLTLDVLCFTFQKHVNKSFYNWLAI